MELEQIYNYSITSLGRIINNKTGRELKQWISTDKNGYQFLRVNLSKDGKGKNFTVARLLAMTFIPNPENKPCVDHIDRNSLNNNLNNLRWVTHKENSNNRKKQSDNTSGHTGISWYKQAEKWRVDHKKKYIGSFETIEEAIVVRDKAFSESGSTNHI